MPSPNRSIFGKKRILNREYMQKTKKLSRVDLSHPYLNYTGLASVPTIPKETWRTVHEKQNFGSARRATHLTGSFFVDW